MSKTVDKIRSLAKKAAEERMANEREKVEKYVNADLAVIEKILAMVKDRLVYKETKTYGNRKTYVVVTEEMVLEDYTHPPEYGSGTKIEDVESSFYQVSHKRINVNGHTYYHAEDLFKRYEWEIQKAAERSRQEIEIINDKAKYMQTMREMEPVVKEIMLNYQKHLGSAPPNN